MQRFLSRTVEVWFLFLALILCAIGAIGFSAIALNEERGKGNFGPAGKVVLAIADVPETIHRLIRERDPMASEQPGRFAGEPGGWTFPAGAAPLPGFLLLSRHDGALHSHVVELVSLKDGSVLYRWPVPSEALFAGAPDSKIAEYPRGSNRFFRAIHPYLFDDGSVLIKDHKSYTARMDACGKPMWRLDTILTHHSTESDGAGGLWLPAMPEKPTFEKVEEAWREDTLLHLGADGTILSTESLPQIFIDNGMEWAIFNEANRSRDPLHLNDIQPVLEDGPYWKKGDLFLSMRHISMIMLYRPATKKIVWMKQGPWLAQHDVDILDDHRISIFDNHAYNRGLGGRVEGANRVVIYDFATGRTSGPWDQALATLQVQTLSEGLQTVLPDGGLMVEEENAGRILFLGADQSLRAAYINRAENGEVYRLGWSRWIDPSTGNKVLAALKNTRCDG